MYEEICNEETHCCILRTNKKKQSKGIAPTFILSVYYVILLFSFYYVFRVD